MPELSAAEAAYAALQAGQPAGHGTADDAYTPFMIEPTLPAANSLLHTPELVEGCTASLRETFHSFQQPPRHTELTPLIILTPRH